MRVSLLFVLLFVVFSVCCINGSLSLRQRKRGWFSNSLSKLIPKRCLHKGNYYDIGDIFDRTYNPQTKMCTALQCKSSGNIETIIVNNCPRGCHHNGQYYQPGAEISSHNSGNCYTFTRCDSNGHIIAGDSQGCFVTPTTTPPITTPPITPPPGCKYNGQYYQPGTVISSHQYGNCRTSTMCGENGHIIVGDSQGCFETPTTTPPITPPPGCKYNGQYYQPGDVISSHQYGNCRTSTMCGENGHIIVGDSQGCFESPTPSTTALTSTTEAVTGKRSLEEEIRSLLRKFNRRK